MPYRDIEAPLQIVVCRRTRRELGQDRAQLLAVVLVVLLAPARQHTVGL